MSRYLNTYPIAYEPDLIPPIELMRTEGIDVLEDWFRWGEEWSMLLRVYGGLGRRSAVLEIGCGLGRTAFPLRYLLSSEGSYDGFEITREKVDFLNKAFHRSHRNFRFVWADIHNECYNPGGRIKPTDYWFPYEDESFDVIYAASVFTHMLPQNVHHYFSQARRVLKPTGRCVFSFFLLDNYQKDRPRAPGFERPAFNFDHEYLGYGSGFAIGVPRVPEEMTAYRTELIRYFAGDCGMRLKCDPVVGSWSGAIENSIGAQDLIVLVRD